MHFDIHGSNPLILHDVLYIPELANMLISIGCLDDAGFTITFGAGKGVIQNKNGEIVSSVSNRMVCIALSR